MAKTPHLPRDSTAFAAKTPPLPCVGSRLSSSFHGSFRSYHYSTFHRSLHQLLVVAIKTAPHHLVHCTVYCNATAPARPPPPALHHLTHTPPAAGSFLQTVDIYTGTVGNLLNYPMQVLDPKTLQLAIAPRPKADARHSTIRQLPLVAVLSRGRGVETLPFLALLLSAAAALVLPAFAW